MDDTTLPKKEKESLSLTVEVEGHGARLDRYLSQRFPEHSRSFFQKIIRDGQVLVDGVSAQPGAALRAHSRIEVRLPAPREAVFGPEDIPVAVVFEDDWIAVIDKPAGLSVHPGAGRISGTLISALLFRGMRLAAEAGPDRPGIVHRLDKDTSGLLVVAKDDTALAGLKLQFSSHTTERLYHGICWGRIGQDNGTIETLIGRHSRERKRMTTRTETGREAITEYRVLERFPHMTYGQFRLKTGRTHQIRVHMASLGHPIVGDRTYGSMRAAKRLESGLVREAVQKLGRQALHASSLGFVHPVTGEFMHFESALPADIAHLLSVLRDEN